jgi:peptide/nickel transport system permease protein
VGRRLAGAIGSQFPTVKLFGLRLLRLIIVVLVVTFATFMLLDATPGDPAVWKLGLNADPVALAEIREELGLDRPVLVRYFDWLGNAAMLDFGESLNLEGITAAERLGDALPQTVELMILAEVFALTIAVPAALWSAQRPNRAFDRISSTMAFALLALPAFILGIYLKFLFGVKLGWFPTIVTDLPGITEDPLANLRQMFLPSITLALNLVAIYLRVLRSDIIDTLQEDYIMLAQSRGFTTRRVMWRHALRPSSLNLTTAIGLNIAALISGALIVEFVFAINGMGRLIIDSIFGKDFALASSAILILTAGFVIINFLVDIAYSILDPRIRHAE